MACLCHLLSSEAAGRCGAAGSGSSVDEEAALARQLGASPLSPADPPAFAGWLPLGDEAILPGWPLSGPLSLADACSLGAISVLDIRPRGAVMDFNSNRTGNQSYRAPGRR